MLKDLRALLPNFKNTRACSFRPSLTFTASVRCTQPIAGAVNGRSKCNSREAGTVYCGGGVYASFHTGPHLSVKGKVDMHVSALGSSDRAFEAALARIAAKKGRWDPSFMEAVRCVRLKEVLLTSISNYRRISPANAVDLVDAVHKSATSSVAMIDKVRPKLVRYAKEKSADGWAARRVLSQLNAHVYECSRLEDYVGEHFTDIELGGPITTGFQYDATHPHHYSRWNLFSRYNSPRLMSTLNNLQRGRSKSTANSILQQAGLIHADGTLPHLTPELALEARKCGVKYAGELPYFEDPEDPMKTQNLPPKEASTRYPHPDPDSQPRRPGPYYGIEHSPSKPQHYVPPQPQPPRTPRVAPKVDVESGMKTKDLPPEEASARIIHPKPDSQPRRPGPYYGIEHSPSVDSSITSSPRPARSGVSQYLQKVTKPSSKPARLVWPKETQYVAPGPKSQPYPRAALDALCNNISDHRRPMAHRVSNQVIERARKENFPLHTMDTLSNNTPGSYCRPTAHKVAKSSIKLARELNLPPDPSQAYTADVPGMGARV